MELRTWRQAQGWTLERLGYELKVTTATVSRYELRKRTTMGAETINAIFKLTKGQVTASDLHGQTPKIIAELINGQKKSI